MLNQVHKFKNFWKFGKVEESTTLKKAYSKTSNIYKNQIKSNKNVEFRDTQSKKIH